MAMPTWVAAGTASGSIVGLTPNMPAGIQADDILMMFVHSNDNEAVTLTTANGFVETSNSPQRLSLSDHRCTVFWKRAVGGDAAPVIADPGDHLGAVIVAIRGCKTTGDPWNQTTQGLITDSASLALSATGATTTVANCLVLVLSTSTHGTTAWSAWANADLASVTERVDAGGTEGTDWGFGMATGEKATPGAYGATTATSSNATRKIWFTFALEGTAASATGYFDGRLDEIAIYKGTVLDSATIINHYRVGIGAPTAFTIVSYRGRNDDGTEATATWKAAENTGWTQPISETFRTRFEEQETSGGAGVVEATLHYRINGVGDFQAVGDGSGDEAIIAASSPNVTDNQTLTNQLTQGTGTYAAGRFDETDGVASSDALVANGHTEFEFASQLVDAHLNAGDIIELRAIITSAVTTATQTATITAAAAALTVTTTTVPNANVGVAYSTTLAKTGGLDPVTWSIISGALPSGLTLAAATGVISGTTTVAGAASFTVRATDSLGTPQTDDQALTLTVIPDTLIVTTTILPGGTVGSAYSQTLAKSGGTDPVTWAVLSGSLPANLTLSGAGVISGTPSAAGTASFTVRATDAAGTPQIDDQALQIEVIALGPPPLPSLIVRLEFSEDPLSDTTPTYVEVTGYLKDIKWWGGKDSDRGESQPGGVSILLKNTDPAQGTVRDWEPDFVAGRFYPNVDTHRRFRLFVDYGAGIQQEGLWYATDYEVTYPGGTAYSEVVVTGVDGFEILSNDNLPLLDPPDATSITEVYQFDGPSFHYRLGEPAGTKMVGHLRSKKWKRRHPHRRRRFRTRETAAELGGVSGPAGTYKNTPELGVPGLILGDPDTAVNFRVAQSEFAQVQVDQSDAIDANRLTVEAWIKPTSVGGVGVFRSIVGGPFSTIDGSPAFRLHLDTNRNLHFFVLMTDGVAYSVASTTALTLGNTAHVAGTWDGQDLRVYINGLEDGSRSASGLTAKSGDAGQNLLIGKAGVSAYFDGVIDEVAVYEAALSPARILAHYTAGSARGFPEQTAEVRIGQLAASSLWTVLGNAVGSFNVQPTMQYGQSKLDEIRECVAAEQPHAQFFFDGGGNARYLGWQYKATSSYMTPQATIGDSGAEVPYQSIELDHDNEFYNEWTLSADGGLAQTVSDAASISARRRRAHPPETGLINSSDADVLALANANLGEFKEPAHRPTTVTLNSASELARTQIGALNIGEMVRVRRRGEGGTPIDRMTHILGYTKSLDVNRHLVCTYNLSRGWNAGVDGWRAGVPGFSEAGTTTVAG